MNPRQDDGNQRRKGALDYLNQGVNTVKQGAQTLQITETIASTFTLGSIGAVIIISVVFFLIFFLGKPNPVSGTNGTTTPMPIDQVKQYIIVDHDDSSNGSCDFDKKSACEPGQQITDPKELNFIYNTFAIPLGSANYRKLLSNSDGTPRPIHIFFFDPLPGTKGRGSTGGAGYGPTNMVFWGFWELYNVKADTADMQAHILVHESGHIIQHRDLWPSGFDASKLSKQDTACYDNEWLKTYAYRSAGTTNPARKDPTTGKAPADCTYPYSPPESYRTTEDEAEALANNVFCAPGASCDYNKVYCSTGVVYNGSCNATYDWIKQNIFGGDDFFTDSGGGSSQSIADVPPSSDYCGNAQYTSYGARNASIPKFLHKDAPNFGDPQCTLSTQGRNALLQQLITETNGSTTMGTDGTLYKDSDLWFNYIIPNEAPGYNPNAFNPGSTSGLGAYGLFQMNPKHYRSDGSLANGFDDIGDVNWPLQTHYAVGRNTSICKWAYWGTSTTYLTGVLGIDPRGKCTLNKKPTKDVCIPQVQSLTYLQSCLQ